MPHLELIDTPVGPRYRLDGQPLANDDVIEVIDRFASEVGVWYCGRLLWAGKIDDAPFIYSQQAGHMILEGTVARWVPVQPKAEHLTEPGVPLEDRERRNG